MLEATKLLPSMYTKCDLRWKINYFWWQMSRLDDSPKCYFEFEYSITLQGNNRYCILWLPFEIAKSFIVGTGSRRS